MTFQPSVSRLLSRFGETWTIRKRTLAAGGNGWTAGSATDAFSTFRARMRDVKPTEIGGGIQIGDFIVTADPTSFSVTPYKGDLIARGEHASISTGEWMQVVDAPAEEESGATVLYKLQARR